MYGNEKKKKVSILKILFDFDFKYFLHERFLKYIYIFWVALSFIVAAIALVRQLGQDTDGFGEWLGMAIGAGLGVIVFLAFALVLIRLMTEIVILFFRIPGFLREANEINEQILAEVQKPGNVRDTAGSPEL